MKKLIQIMRTGVVDQNPVFIQLLALCPLLAVTTTAMNGVAMGAATTLVMICAGIVISLLRKLIPSNIRIACFVVIIAALVTMIQLLMHAYMPDVNNALGIFIPLIAVNCIVFARVESFAFKNGVFFTIVDALSMGAGFTLGLAVVGIIREFFGSGSFFGFPVIADSGLHMLIMVAAPGGFFTLGIIVMVVRFMRSKKKGAGN